MLNFEDITDDPVRDFKQLTDEQCQNITSLANQLALFEHNLSKECATFIAKNGDGYNFGVVGSKLELTEELISGIRKLWVKYLAATQKLNCSVTLDNISIH